MRWQPAHFAAKTGATLSHVTRSGKSGTPGGPGLTWPCTPPVATGGCASERWTATPPARSAAAAASATRRRLTVIWCHRAGRVDRRDRAEPRRRLRLSRGGGEPSGLAVRRSLGQPGRLTDRGIAAFAGPRAPYDPRDRGGGTAADVRHPGPRIACPVLRAPHARTDRLGRDSPHGRR